MFQQAPPEERKELERMYGLYCREACARKDGSSPANEIYLVKRWEDDAGKFQQQIPMRCEGQPILCEGQ